MANAIRTNREEQGNRVDGFALLEPVGKLSGYHKRLVSFLHDVRVEMKQVNWPARSEVISTTVVVIVTVTFFGLYFLAADTVVGKLIGALIQYGRHH